MTDNNNETPFSIFEKTNQEQIIQAMILDRKWASQFCEVIKPEYFDYAYLKKVCEYYLDFQKKYKDFPSMSMMTTIVKENLKNTHDATLKTQIIDFFCRIAAEKHNIGDLAYVKEKSLEYCKRMALKNALVSCVDLITTDKYENTVDIIRKAISLGTENSIGLSLCDDIEARYESVKRNVITTGFSQLDDKKVLKGGFGRGEIGIICAASGIGKSQLMVQFGANALKAGFNVLYYTLELKESTIGIRFDSSLTGISSTDCYEHKQEIGEYYKTNKNKLGRLIIKQFPPSSITTNQLRAHIEKLSSNGFIPDFLIIDYAGLLRSQNRYELLRLEMKMVLEEVRGLAIDLNIACLTALQSNKEGLKADVIDESNLAESYSQAGTCDFIGGLQRNKKTGYGTFSIAKNRNGIDGIHFPIHLDCSTSTLRIISEEEQINVNNDEEDKSKQVLLDAMRTAYKKSSSKNNNIDNILEDLNLNKVQ